jgi:hypothetical protein
MKRRGSPPSSQRSRTSKRSPNAKPGARSCAPRWIAWTVPSSRRGHRRAGRARSSGSSRGGTRAPTAATTPATAIRVPDDPSRVALQWEQRMLSRLVHFRWGGMAGFRRRRFQSVLRPPRPPSVQQHAWIVEQSSSASFRFTMSPETMQVANSSTDETPTRRTGCRAAFSRTGGRRGGESKGQKRRTIDCEFEAYTDIEYDELLKKMYGSGRKARGGDCGEEQPKESLEQF